MGSSKLTFSNFTPWSYFPKKKMPKFIQTKDVLKIPFQFFIEIKITNLSTNLGI
jgi:hypothetical protein